LATQNRIYHNLVTHINNTYFDDPKESARDPVPNEGQPVKTLRLDPPVEKETNHLDRSYP